MRGNEPYHPIPSLSFGFDNAKLTGQGIATFSLPAGYSCPRAKECLSRASRKTGKIIDGPNTKIRCFAATMELRAKSLRQSVDRNLRILKQAATVEEKSDLIYDAMPRRGWRTIRMHVNGDFFDESYFLAWMDVARREPDRFFYGYTKSLDFWVNNMAAIPDNVLLTASWGGTLDHLIEPNNLRSALIVQHPKVAELMGLEVDHDDSLARNRDVHKFALLMHGTQPKGTEAAANLTVMRREKVPFSYPDPRKKPKAKN